MSEVELKQVGEGERKTLYLLHVVFIFALFIAALLFLLPTFMIPSYNYLGIPIELRVLMEGLHNTGPSLRSGNVCFTSERAWLKFKYVKNTKIEDSQKKHIIIDQEKIILGFNPQDPAELIARLLQKLLVQQGSINTCFNSSLTILITIINRGDESYLINSFKKTAGPLLLQLSRLLDLKVAIQFKFLPVSHIEDNLDSSDVFSIIRKIIPMQPDLLNLVFIPESLKEIDGNLDFSHSYKTDSTNEFKPENQFKNPAILLNDEKKSDSRINEESYKPPIWLDGWGALVFDHESRHSQLDSDIMNSFVHSISNQIFHVNLENFIFEDMHEGNIELIVKSKLQTIEKFQNISMVTATSIDRLEKSIQRTRVASDLILSRWYDMRLSKKELLLLFDLFSRVIKKVESATSLEEFARIAMEADLISRRILNHPSLLTDQTFSRDQLLGIFLPLQPLILPVIATPLRILMSRIKNR